MPLDTIIEIENATITYDENIILTDVNFKVNRGDFIYLIGKTGTGKTSLLRTLYADLILKNGTATVAGFDLRKIKKRQVPFLRRKIGIVFQDFQLLTDRNVHDNLEFVLKATGWRNKKNMEERIKDVLEKVDLGFKDYKMPHQLSGGEQQRVVIARALLNDPELILADEPTGNLDPETSDGIMELLHSISKTGRAIIMATHDYMSLKKFSALTYRCQNGKLFQAEGPDNVIDFEEIAQI